MRFGAALTMFAALVVLALGCTTRDSDEFRYPVELTVFDDVAPRRLVVTKPDKEGNAYPYVVTDNKLFKVGELNDQTTCEVSECYELTSVAVDEGFVFLGTSKNPASSRPKSCNESPGGVLRMAENVDCLTKKGEDQQPKPTFIFEGEWDRDMGGVQDLAVDTNGKLYWISPNWIYDQDNPNDCETLPCENGSNEVGVALEAMTVDDIGTAWITTADVMDGSCKPQSIWEVHTSGVPSTDELVEFKACAPDIVYAPKGAGVTAALFWVDVGTLDVHRASPQRKTSSVVASGFTWPIAIAADGDHVYWLDRGKLGESDGVLWRYDRRSEEVAMLLEGLDEPTDIALERNRIYWIEQGKSNRLMTLAK